MMMTGVALSVSRERMNFSTSTPLNFGIIRSSTTTSGFVSASSFIASRPSLARSTAKPALVKPRT